MAAVTISSEFGAQENKVCHCFHCFSIYLSWSDGARCHDLSFFELWVSSHLLHSPLSTSSRGSLFPFHFLPLGGVMWIWGYRYFSHQSCYCVTTLLLMPSWILLISNYNFLNSSKFIQLRPMAKFMQSILSLAYLNSTQIRTIKNYLSLWKGSYNLEAKLSSKMNTSWSILRHTDLSRGYSSLHATKWTKKINLLHACTYVYLCVYYVCMN